VALIDLLRENLILLLGVAGLLGLIAGSFLNVVICRLPAMMQRAWEAECREALQATLASEPQTAETLIRPASHCPHCGHPLRAYENIPLLGYLLLRGRCSACGTRISLQYPLVELVAAAAAVSVAAFYGMNAQMAAAALFSFALIALAGIDLRTQLLPDIITLPLLWAGIFVNLLGLFTDLPSSVIGAMAGYLSLWIIFHIFKLLTGKEGMGYGDFKLLAALGAWTGWQALVLIVLLSSLIGAVVGIGLIVLRSMGRDIPIPFGPYLAGAGWIALLYGKELNTLYLQFVLGNG
jgi:leader peptidase (prepilin peptidase) / N-methyltransferase